MKAEPREAATLVLMRDRSGARPEVLMVQRHSQDVFAAGAYVFPGGVLESGDSSPASLALSDRLTPEQAREILSTAESPERALGYYLAAVRETFEEAGVLLARTEAGDPWRPRPEDAETLQGARADLRDGRLDFAAVMRGLRLRPAVESLVYFAHWVTPAGRPKRFDTRFFLAAVDDSVAVEPDLKEIVDYRWIAPADAVAAYENQTLRMVNATVRNLELLAGYPSAREATEALRARAVQAIRPKLVPQPDGTVKIIHPWEPGYETH